MTSSKPALAFLAGLRARYLVDESDPGTHNLNAKADWQFTTNYAHQAQALPAVKLIELAD